MTTKQKFLFFGIILVAIFFRFYQIGTLPGGLFPDEAANGLDINLMQTGQLQPFYERGNGREGLFFYMLWGSVEAFGKGPWQHHIVSALVGVLSVIFCFLATRRLFLVNPEAIDESFKTRATHIALLAAFLMAASTWHIVLSRTAFRANLIPLFSTMTFYFLLCAYQAATLKKQLFYAFFTGAAFALGFYTYIAFRIMVPILAVLTFWPLLAIGFTDGIKRYWKQFCILIFAFCIFVWPLAKYFYTHPGSFVGRSGQVSVFNPELNQGNLPGAIWEVFKQSMLGFFTHGDLNWRHNISGLPLLSPLISIFFGLGLVAVTFLGLRYIFSPRKKAHYWKYSLLAVWFWGMLLPVITTAEGIPHGLRSIGAIPVVFIISALGLYYFGVLAIWFHNRAHPKQFKETGGDWQQLLIDKMHVRKTEISEQVETFRSRVVIGFFKLTVVCFTVAIFLQTYFLYFVYAANSPENYYAFRSDLTPVSKYLVQRCQKDSTYLILDKFSVQTTDYLTSDWHGNFNSPCNVPYKQVDPESAWELKDLKKDEQIVFTQSSIFDIKKFKEYYPEAYLSLEYRNKFNQAVMAVYKVSN